MPRSSAHVVDVDQHRRRDDAAPDVDDEIGAAAEQLTPGWLARAAMTPSSVVGRSSWNSGSASITCLRSVCRGAFAGGAAALLDRLEHAVGRHRQVVEPDADGVGDRVGERRQEGGERAFARLLRAERAMRVVALDDADLDRRRVLDGRHAVVEHVGGEQQALVVGGLLAHRLAHAHPDRALHLAFDREPVERLAAVVRDPHLVDGRPRRSPRRR